MVAYSFKRRFVDPIRVGLGLEIAPAKIVAVSGPGPMKVGDSVTFPTPAPKRQTIRAHGKRRHARPGDELQLYCGMRTKGCFLIGRARCVAVENLTLWHGTGDLKLDLTVMLGGKLLGPRQLAAFARGDGFTDAADMARFWNEEHGARAKWQGIVVRWEPIVDAGPAP